MIALLAVVALYLEPIGSVLEEPYDFVEPIEVIDVQPLEELERKLRIRNLRIMSTDPREWSQ